MAKKSSGEAAFIGDDTDPYDPLNMANETKRMQEETGATASQARALIERRRQAYSRVFMPGKRDQADIDFVLADLMWFCRAYSPTFDVRDGQHAEHLATMKEGRREVFTRIKHFSRLDGDALLLMYTDATTKP